MVKFVVNEGFEHRYSPVTWDDVARRAPQPLNNRSRGPAAEWTATRSLGPFGAREGSAMRTIVSGLLTKPLPAGSGGPARGVSAQENLSRPLCVLVGSAPYRSGAAG